MGTLNVIKITLKTNQMREIVPSTYVAVCWQEQIKWEQVDIHCKASCLHRQVCNNIYELNIIHIRPLYNQQIRIIIWDLRYFDAPLGETSRTWARAINLLRNVVRVFFHSSSECVNNDKTVMKRGPLIWWRKQRLITELNTRSRNDLRVKINVVTNFKWRLNPRCTGLFHKRRYWLFQTSYTSTRT